MLFLLYINDIAEDIHPSIRLFAEDTSLYIIVDNPFQAAEQLNSDLQFIAGHPDGEWPLILEIRVYPFL